MSRKKTVTYDDGKSEEIYTIKVKGGHYFTINVRYQFVKPISVGAYGVVIKARDAAASKKSNVAIKNVTHCFENTVDAKRVMREVKVLRHFTEHSHPNIIRLTDLMATPQNKTFKNVYLVMEHMPTDLHKVIYSKKNRLTNAHFQKITYQALKALHFVHSANVIHRDLKPSNLLLDGNCGLKVCDFGLSRSLEQESFDKKMTEYVVTRWYRSPEIMCSSPYDEKIDVWALGCILAEMLLGKALFEGKNYREQIALIVRFLVPDDTSWIQNSKARDFVEEQIEDDCERVDFSSYFDGDEVDPKALDLLEAMLQFNPEERITVRDALRHPWLSKARRSREPECEEEVDFSFEDNMANMRSIKQEMWREVRAFRPHYPETRTW